MNENTFIDYKGGKIELGFVQDAVLIYVKSKLIDLAHISCYILCWKQITISIVC